MKNSKLKKLKSILAGLQKVVVAYSGGLDSTFLLKAALDTLGEDNVIAVTARSQTYPYSEYKEAKMIAKRIGVRHLTIYTNELALKNFRSNPVNRCYYCKKELFERLGRIKDREGGQYVIDGTNLDDLNDVRHGMKAAKEFGVRSPLLEAGIAKRDMRTYSRLLRLPTWNKPSFACLASRFPFNSSITRSNLIRIEKAEEYLRKLGFRQVRVRLHKNVARIELLREDFRRAVNLTDVIAKRMKGLGFIYAALDLSGYRTGSMHEASDL